MNSHPTKYTDSIAISMFLIFRLEETFYIPEEFLCEQTVYKSMCVGVCVCKVLRIFL